MSVEAQIINLDERRNRKIAAAPPPPRPFPSAARLAGSVLMFAALAFAAYVVYQAVRFGALTDRFVLVMLAIAGAYLLTGAVLVTRAFQRLFGPKSRVADADIGDERVDGTTRQTAVILNFPEPAKAAEPTPAWVRCRY